MTRLTHRDPMVVATALASWVAARTGASDVRVVKVEHPSAGWSSETVLVDLSGNEGETQEFVVRLPPPMVGTFRDYDLEKQVIAQRAAATVGVPVASPELVTDQQWLGAPFVVMPRVRGHIIGVSVADPWLSTLAVDERAQVHESFMACVAATHRADLVNAAGVPARRNDEELDFWADYLEWSSGGAPLRALVDALAWCRAHQPTRESDPVLLWGDVRLENVIFGDDLNPLAVLDWDMTSLGAPEHDVAWFTMLESTVRTMFGQGLDGLPDRDATIAEYEKLSDRTLHDMSWYEIFAAVRSTAILTRISYLQLESGMKPMMPVDNNPVLDLLAARIAAANE